MKFKDIFVHLALMLLATTCVVLAQTPFSGAEISRIYVSHNTFTLLPGNPPAFENTVLAYYDTAAHTLININNTGSKRYNAIAYNPVDNFLYAIENNNTNASIASYDTQGKVLRIGQNSVTAELGYFTFPGGTSMGMNLFSGTFDKSGNYYLYDADDLGTRKIYKITNVAENNLVASVITPDQSYFFSDFAWNPSDGFLYALGGGGSQSIQETNQIIKIDPLTGMTSVVTPGNGLVDNALKPSFFDAAGAIWADKIGNVNFYNNGGYVVRYNVAANTISLDATAAPTFFDSDAASNIAIQTEPAVTNAITPEGSVIASTTTLLNNGPDNAYHVTVSLSIPANLKYTNFVVKDANGNVVPLAANIWSVISEPAVNASNTTLQLSFAVLLPGVANGYTIMINNTRVNTVTEVITTEAAINSIDGVAVTNTNSTVPGDVAPNNAATASYNVPLPVTLVSFKAVASEKNAVLEWQTTQETNSDFFEVQYSLNSSNWLIAGKVKAAGSNNSRRLNYSFTHRNVSDIAPMLYYRLRMVDLDGTYTTSRIASIKSQNETLPLAYGYNRTIYIKTTSANDFLVINVSGTIINYGSLTGEKSIGIATPGVYIVYLTNKNGEIRRFKVVM